MAERLSTSTLAADVSGKLVAHASQPNAAAQKTADAFQGRYRPSGRLERISHGTAGIMAA